MEYVEFIFTFHDVVIVIVHLLTFNIDDITVLHPARDTCARWCNIIVVAVEIIQITEFQALLGFWDSGK